MVVDVDLLDGISIALVWEIGIGFQLPRKEKCMTSLTVTLHLFLLVFPQGKLSDSSI